MSSQPTIESLLIPSKTRVPDVRAGTIRRHAAHRATPRFASSDHHRHGARRLWQVAASCSMGRRGTAPARLALARSRRLGHDALPPVRGSWLSCTPSVLEADQLPSSVGMANARIAPSGDSDCAGHEPTLRARHRRHSVARRRCTRRLAPARSRHSCTGRSSHSAAGPTSDDCCRAVASEGRRWSSRPADLAFDDTRGARALRERRPLIFRMPSSATSTRHVEGWAAGLYLCGVGDARNGITSGFRRDAPRPLRLRLLRRRIWPGSRRLSSIS